MEKLAINTVLLRKDFQTIHLLGYPVHDAAAAWSQIVPVDTTPIQ